MVVRTVELRSERSLGAAGALLLIRGAPVLPDPVLQLLRPQRGLVAHHQLRRHVPDRNERRRVHRHSDLEAMTPRVLRHRAVPPSREQAVMAAVLDAGPDARLWSRSAATLLGFGRDRILPAHVAVPRRHTKYAPLGRLHVIRDLDPRDVTTHLDIPVGRPEVVLLWIAGALTHRFLRRQVTIDASPVIRTVDYRVDDRPLIVEINGKAWHTSLTDRAADRERYERCKSLGFSVVVYWEYDVWHDAATVRRTLDGILEQPDRMPTLHRPTPAPWDC